MYVYFLPVFYYAIVTGIARSPRKNTILSGFGILALIVFTGFRLDSDNDYQNYLFYFDQIPAFGSGALALIEDPSVYFEPGFTLLVSLYKAVGFYGGEFLIISALSLLCYFFVFAHETRLPSAAFLIYVCDGYLLREFTQIRFGLAVALCAVSICFLRERRYIVYLLFSLLAASVHYVAFIVFLLPIWMQLTGSRYKIIALVLFAFLLHFFNVSQFVVSLLSYLGSSRIDYFNGTDDSLPADLMKTLPFVFVLGLLLLCNFDAEEFFYVKVYSFFVVLLILFTDFDIMRRSAFIFAPSLYVLFAISLQNRRFFTSIVVLVLSSITFVYRLDIVYPYKFSGFL